MLTAASKISAVEGKSVPVTALHENGGKTYVVVKEKGTGDDANETRNKNVDVNVVRIADGFALIESDSIDNGTVVVVAQ